MSKKYDAGVKEYRDTYWTPDYVPLDTDLLACFKCTGQEGVPKEEVAAAVAAESSTGRGETLSLRLQELCSRVLDDWHQMFSTGDHLCLGIISPVVLDSGLDRLSWLELLNNFSIVRTEQNNRSTESFVFCRRGNLFTGLFA